MFYLFCDRLKAQSQLKQLRELQAERRTEEAARKAEEKNAPATEAARAVPEKAKAAAVRTSDSIDLTRRIGFEFSGPPNKEQIDAYLGIPSGGDPLEQVLKELSI